MERKIIIEEKQISDFIPDKGKSENQFEFKYSIPKFQRYFVWDYKDIKDLWDSIYRNYPIGSFIIWESDKKLPGNREIANNILFIPTEASTFKYILDGQQRITSLIASILSAKKILPNRKKAIDFTIYFSLRNALKESKENDLEKRKNIQIFYISKEIKKLSEDEKKYLVKVSNLVDFDSNIYAKFYDLGEKEIANLYQKICNKLKTDYKLSVIKLQNIPIEEVCELFTRVNISGKKLSILDLVTANTFHDDFYLRDYIDKLFGENSDLDKLNYEDIDEVIVLRLISVVKAGKKTKINNDENTITCREADLFQLTSEDFKEYWDNASDSLKMAINFLKRMNIACSKILPYPPMLIPLAYFFYLHRDQPLDDNDMDLIKKWFWINSFNGTYQGATNEAIARDSFWFEKFAKGNKDFKFQVKINLEHPKKISDNNIILNEKLNLSSGFCKSILCLMANMNPKDFTNNSPIDIYDVLINYKKSELHHIFPKKSTAVKNYVEDLTNSVVNVCFLPKKSNQTIGNDNPKDYFVKKVKEKNPHHYTENLQSNLIPGDESSGVWDDNFDKFLLDRTNLIIQRIKEITKCHP